MEVKYLIKGKLYDPILFGDEDDDWVGDEENPTCGDCGVHVGEQHLDNCDIERCPRCGLQFISCDCGVKYVVDEKDMAFLPMLIEEQKKENIKEKERYNKLLEELKEKEKKSKGKKFDSEM